MFVENLNIPRLNVCILMPQLNVRILMPESNESIFMTHLNVCIFLPHLNSCQKSFMPLLNVRPWMKTGIRFMPQLNVRKTSEKMPRIFLYVSRNIEFAVLSSAFKIVRTFKLVQSQGKCDYSLRVMSFTLRLYNRHNSFLTFCFCVIFSDKFSWKINLTMDALNIF